MTFPISARRRAETLRRRASLAALAAALPGIAAAGPEGGVVVGGASDIATSGKTTTITQKTNRTVIEWRSFDTAGDEAVRFVQPDRSSVALNRIVSGNPTTFAGKLDANGTVAVINRSGIVFSEGAQVNVGGLIASTTDIDTNKFMAGSNRFDIAGDPNASVVNRGSITFAEKGLAALVGAHAANEGVIAGRLGAAVVSGRQTFAVDITGGDGILALEAPGIASSVSAANSGTIAVEGGYVAITAEETAAALESFAEAGGTIDAGTGGIVKVEAATAVVSGTVTAAGGSVDVRGDLVEARAGALIDVSSAAGGGTVALGGGVRGEGRQALKTGFAPGATIRADGIGDADGGTVSLFSSADTKFWGDITARGGALGGDGGFVEVSSFGAMDLEGAVNVGAPAGEGGQFLIDPTTVVFTATPFGGDSDTDPAQDYDFDDDSEGTTVHIDPADIADMGGEGTLTIEAREDIIIQEDTVATNDDDDLDLELFAGRDIIFNADLTVDDDVTLVADADFNVVGPGDQPSDGEGSIIFNNGADLSVGDNLSVTIGTDAGEAIIFNDTGDAEGYTIRAGLNAVGVDALTLGRVIAHDDVDIDNQFGALVLDGLLTNDNAAAATVLGAAQDVVINAGIDVDGTLALDGDSNAAFDGIVEVNNGADVVAGGLLTVNISAANGEALTFTDTGDGESYLFESGDALALPETDVFDDVTFVAQVGNITQTDALTSADADKTVTFNAAGSVLITDANNDIRRFGGSSTTDATFVTDGASTIVAGFDAGTGAFTLAMNTNNATVSQTGAVIASTLKVNTVGTGAVTFDHADNAFDALDPDVLGDLTVVNNGDLSLFFDVLPNDLLDITLHATGTEDGDLAGGSVAIDTVRLRLDIDGAADFAAATHSFEELEATTGGASDFTVDDDLELHDSAFGGPGATITVQGAGNDLTQAGGTGVAGSMTLVVADSITLTNAENTFNALSVSSQGSASSFRTTPEGGELQLGASFFTGGTAIQVDGADNGLTQSGALSGGPLDLSVTGDVTLDDPANDVDTLTGGVGGALVFAEDSDLSLGILAGSMIIFAGGNISDSAGATETDAGGAAFFAFDGGALSDDISDDTYFNVTISDAGSSFAGPVSGVAAQALIRTTADLEVADFHVTQNSQFRSGGTLTADRIAAGDEVGASGATVEIDIFADLLLAGDTVIAKDIQAERLDIGGTTSVQGGALAALTEIDLDRFEAGSLFVGNAPTIGLRRATNQALITSLVLPAGANVTLGGLDLSGTGIETFDAGGANLTLDGVLADELVITNAANVALGFLDITGNAGLLLDGNLTVSSSGAIVSLPDDRIGVGGPFTVDGPNVAGISDAGDVTGIGGGAGLPSAADGLLIDVAGATSLTAGTLVALVESNPDEAPGQTFGNDFQGEVSIFDFDAADATGVAVALQDANSLTIGTIQLRNAETGGADLSDIALEAGASGFLQQNGAIEASGVIIAMAGSGVRLDAAGNLWSQMAVSTPGFADVASDIAITQFFADVGNDLLLGSQTSIVGVSGFAGDNISISAPVTSVDGLHAGGTMSIFASNGDAVVSNVTATDELAIFSFGTDVTLTASDAIVTGAGARLRLTSHGDVLAQDMTSSGSVEVATILGVSASAGADLGNISAETLDIDVRDDVTIGAITVTDFAGVQSRLGSVALADETDAAAFAGGATSIAAVADETFEVEIHDADADGADDALGFTRSGQAAQAFTPTDADTSLSVAGHALFVAASTDNGTLGTDASLIAGAGMQNITILQSGGDHDIALNTVSIRADGNVSLFENDGGFAFDVPATGAALPDAPEVIPEISTTAAARRAADMTGNLSIRIEDTGRAATLTDEPDDGLGDDTAQLDGIRVGGTTTLSVEGDVILDGLDGSFASDGNGATDHRFEGAVSILDADDVVISSLSALTFDAVNVQSLVARSTGGIFDSAGQIMVAGTSLFSAWDDQGDGDVFSDSGADVLLDNGTHVFGGAVSAAGRIVDIRAGVGGAGAAQDLAVADVYASETARLSAARNLTAERVSVGDSVSKGSGDPSFAIDLGGALIAASGGTATFTDVIAGTLDVGASINAGGTAADGAAGGAVSLERFEIFSGFEIVSAGAVSVAQGNSDFLGFIDAGGAFTLRDIDMNTGDLVATGASGTSSASGILGTIVDLSAPNLLIGFMQVDNAITLEATTGSVGIMADDDLNALIPTATPITVEASNIPRTFPSSDPGESQTIRDVTLARGAFINLIEAPTLNVTAVGDALLPGKADGSLPGSAFENDVDVFTFDAQGVAFEDRNGFAIGAASAVNAALRAGAADDETGDVTQTGALSITGTLSVIVDADSDTAARGNVTLTDAANALTDVQLIAHDAELRDADGFNVTGAQLDGAFATNIAQAGPVQVQDVTAATVTALGAGDVTLSRISASDLVVADAGGFADASDIAAGTLAVTGATGASLQRFSAGATMIGTDAGGALVADGAASELFTALFPGVAGVSGGLTLRNVSAELIQVNAAGGIVAQAVRQTDAGQSMTLIASSGDVELGRIAAAGDASIGALSGGVFSRDAGDGAGFVIPGADVTVDLPDAATVGQSVALALGNAAADDRVTEDLAAASDLSLSSPAVSEWLGVGGDLLLVALGGAAGEVNLAPADDATDSFVNGAIMLEAEGNASLSIGGPLVFDDFATSFGSVALQGAGEAFAVDVGGNLLIRSGAAGGAAGGITQDAGLGASPFRVDGASVFVTGVHRDGTLTGDELADIALESAENVFAGTVSLLGSDVTLAAAGDLTVADALALDGPDGDEGALSLTAAGLLTVNAAEADLSIALTGASVDAANLIAPTIGATATTGDARVEAAVATESHLTVQAAGELTVDQIATADEDGDGDGDIRLESGGEMRLGALASADELAAQSLTDAIRARASAGATEIAGADFAATEADGVTLNQAARANRAIPAAAAHLDVTGGAAFLSGGAADIVLPAVGGLDNLFAGGVAATTAGRLYLSDGGATLAIGVDGTGDGLGAADDLPVFLSGAAPANGVFATEDAHILSAGSVNQTPGADLSVGGTLQISAAAGLDLTSVAAGGGLEIYAEGQDVTLGVSGPTVLNILADSLTVTTDSDLHFDSAILRSLTVTGAGADPIEIGDEEVTVTLLDAAFTGTEGAAEIVSADFDTFPAAAADGLVSDAARDALADDPALLLTTALTVDQTGAGAVTVIFDDERNLLPADVRISVMGGVTLVEEQLSPGTDAVAYAVSDLGGLGETELLQFNLLNFGGDFVLTTPDQIQFMEDVALAAGTLMDVTQIGDDLTAAGFVDPTNPAILFRGDFGAAVGAVGDPDARIRTAGDIYFFGMVGGGEMSLPDAPGGVLGALTDGGTFAPLGDVILKGFNILAGVRPETFAGDPSTNLSHGNDPDRNPAVAGLIQLEDLRTFVDGLGAITDVAGDGDGGGPLGLAQFQIEDGTVQEDFFFADRLDVGSDGGDILLLVDRDEAGRDFQNARQFFGVNIRSAMAISGGVAGSAPPGSFEAYGRLDGDRSPTAGIRIDSPLSLTFFFNGCRVRQTSDCTQLGANLTLPPLPPLDVPIFEVETLDLSDLFGAIGNEDLWRLPPVYLSDSVIAGVFDHAGDDADDKETEE